MSVHRLMSLWSFTSDGNMNMVRKKENITHGKQDYSAVAQFALRSWNSEIPFYYFVGSLSECVRLWGYYLGNRFPTLLMFSMGKIWTMVFVTASKQKHILKNFTLLALEGVCKIERHRKIYFSTGHNSFALQDGIMKCSAKQKNSYLNRYAESFLSKGKGW